MAGITHAEAADLATDYIYDPVTPNMFDAVLHIEDDVIGIKYVDDMIIIDPAGSETRQMWKDNAEIFPYKHAVLGNMHSGFFKPAMAIYAVVKTLAAGKRIVLTGHSRGAALSGCMALLFLLDGIKVAQLYLFECPKFGYRQSADYLDAQIDAGNVEDPLATENGPDPVPDIPALPGFDYVKPLKPRYVVGLDYAPSNVKSEDGIAALLDNAVVSNWHMGRVINGGVKRRWPKRLLQN